MCLAVQVPGHASVYEAAPEGMLAPEHIGMTDTPQAQAVPLPEQALAAQEGEHVHHQEPAPSIDAPSFDAAS